MKKIGSGLLALLFLLASCGDEASGLARVLPDDAKTMLDEGTALFVDVRSLTEYSKQHIKGAVSIPLNEIVNRLNELPRDKKIITYCA